GPGLAGLVSPRRRAVSVQIDRELASSHLVYPGANVDVIGTLRSTTGAVVSSRIVIQDVHVLGVGSYADVEAVRRGASRSESQGTTGREDSAYEVVTLEVSPEDAERLSLVSREGKIDLALRNAADHEPSKTAGANNQQLLGGGHKASAAEGDGDASAILEIG